MPEPIPEENLQWLGEALKVRRRRHPGQDMREVAGASAAMAQDLVDEINRLRAENEALRAAAAGVEISDRDPIEDINGDEVDVVWLTGDGTAEDGEYTYVALLTTEGDEITRLRIENNDLRATLTAAREEAALKDAEITRLRGALKTVAYHAHAHLTDDMVADFALIAETADAALGRS